MRAFYAFLACLTASICIAISSLAAEEGALSGTFTNWLEHPAIAYGKTAARDPVAELADNIGSGKIALQRDGASGYLRSLLEALHVPLESQSMIFNPDSVQMRRISAKNPRSLFFNDRVVVGWVRGGFIEIAAQDPSQGVVFYRLEQAFAGAPTFKRDDATCLICHYSFGTAGVPGMLARSTQQSNVTHRLAFEKRWGGWYVTGNTGSAPHLGNIDLKHIFDEARPTNTHNWPSLDGKLDLDGYLTPHSDVVALMVFEHQMRMMNLLTRIGWEVRVAEFRRGKTAGQLRAAGDDPADAPVPLDEAAREVVDYMLFVDEAPLPNAITGSTAFAEQFAAQGPRDPKGRSLRDFDLTRRIFKYPLSYMISSPLFDALPAPAKSAIYARLWKVLSERKDSAAILEILRATKPDLPAFFTTQARR